MSSDLLPIPWRPVGPQLQGRKLKIAVMWDDGMALPTPPVTRALRLAAEKLASAGHEITAWSSEDQTAGYDLLNQMFLADGGRAIARELERTGEPWRPEMQMYADAAELTTLQCWHMHLERQAYQKRYLDRWLGAGIDAVLCPTTPYSSVENGKFRHGEFFPSTPFRQRLGSHE